MLLEYWIGMCSGKMFYYWRGNCFGIYWMFCGSCGSFENGWFLWWRECFWINGLFWFMWWVVLLGGENFGVGCVFVIGWGKDGWGR